MEYKDYTEKEYKRAISLLSILFYSITILMISFNGCLLQKEFYSIVKDNILGIVLISLGVLYTRMNEIKAIRKKEYLYFGLIGFLTSFFILLITKNSTINTIWLLGFIIISILWDTNLGILLHILLCFLVTYVCNGTIEMMIYQFLLGIFGCLLGASVKKLKNSITVWITMVSLDLICIASYHKYVMTTSFFNEAFIGISTITVVLIVVYSFTNVKNLKNKVIIKEYKEASLDELMLAATKETIDVNLSKTHTNNNRLEKMDLENELDRILDNECELILRLQKYSKDIYEHSMLVSELSDKAGMYFQLNSKLTKACGLYHEIGRIVGNDYIKEGVNLCKEYNFPEEVISIIKEQNGRYQKPSSMESVIVMLSESVVTTIEYVKKRPEKSTLSMSKIIENVFNNRLNNGMLDGVSMNIKDYNRLKEFYIGYFKE